MHFTDRTNHKKLSPDVIMRCLLRMYSEYRLLAMLTVCTDRTIRQLLLTVRQYWTWLAGEAGNLESTFHWQGRVRNPIPGVQNPQRGIQNPYLSLITLYGAMGHLGIAPVLNIEKKNPFSTTGKVENVIKLFFFSLHYKRKRLSILFVVFP